MSLTSERRRSGRQHVWIAEVHASYCGLRFGEGACQATLETPRNLLTNSENLGAWDDPRGSGGFGAPSSYAGYALTQAWAEDFQPSVWHEPVDASGDVEASIHFLDEPAAAQVLRRIYLQFAGSPQVVNISFRADGTLYSKSPANIAITTGTEVVASSPNGDPIRRVWARLSMGSASQASMGVEVLSTAGGGASGGVPSNYLGAAQLAILQPGDPVPTIYQRVGERHTEGVQSKCYNTETTCPVFASSYDEVGKVFRFVEASENMPMGAGFIPALKSVSITPGKIRPDGGLGSRSAVSITVSDFPHSDIGWDKYRNERDYDPYTTGSFWGKWRARHKFYQGHLLRIWSGYLEEGHALDDFDYSNAQSYDYFIESVSQPSSGSVTITAKDILKAADDSRAQVPPATGGILGGAVTDEDGVSVTLAPAGIGARDYPESGYASIDDEVVRFTRVGDSVTLTQRGMFGTQRAEHEAEAGFQLAAHFPSALASAHVYTLLTAAGVPQQYMPVSEWQAECESFLPLLYTAIIPKPVGVKDLLTELGVSAPHMLMWDERQNKVRFQAVKSPPTDPVTWDDDVHFDDSGVQVSDDPKGRISTAIVNFGLRNPMLDPSDPINYVQTYVYADGDSARQYKGQAIRVINSRWIPGNQRGSAEFAASTLVSRFRDVPREVSCMVLPKDAAVWTGDVVAIRHHKIQEPSGAMARAVMQVTSVAEQGDKLRYTLAEWPSVTQDVSDEFLIVLSGNYLNLRTEDQMHLPPLTLRGLFDRTFGTRPDHRPVVVRLVGDCILGSQHWTHFTWEWEGENWGRNDPLIALDIRSGEWPAETPIRIEMVGNGRQFIVGCGGSGWGDGLDAYTVRDGGDAIFTDRPITILNRGVIGGGGGGGGFYYVADGQTLNGGGGAGYAYGDGTSRYHSRYHYPGEDGTIEHGGAPYRTNTKSHGGDLGQQGLPLQHSGFTRPAEGGKAGKAIVGVSYVTFDGPQGDIRGAMEG